IGLALHNFLDARGTFPSGSQFKVWPGNPAHPQNFYRWSALAELLPFVEQAREYDGLNLDWPLYSTTTSVSPPNSTSVARTIASYLCPSDRAEPVTAVLGFPALQFGIGNYAFCTGTGLIENGSAFDTDGMFFINSALKTKSVVDGLSKTVAASESLLGKPAAASGTPQNAQFVYAAMFGAPLTDTGCASPGGYNVSDPRGFSWANGEYRCGLFNNYLAPNSKTLDCLGFWLQPGPRLYTGWGWRTARSLHPGGVNAVLGDGSVQFYSDSVDLLLWRALSTRAGNEAGSL
ncbi:MAG TPA: DUF1559 domain-containing protein, partial [Planctomycetia bacterium]|nr:DUF1559 domain-containing protein [Planctomycetia bacterium]